MRITLSRYQVVLESLHLLVCEKRDLTTIFATNDDNDVNDNDDDDYN